MEGFIPNVIKYLLFFVNLVLFIFGVSVFGAAIWVAVDSPQFLELFQKAKDVAGQEADIPDMEINIYSSAVYLFIFVAGLVVLVSFFGCCGAWKENKCMLGTYFAIVLLLFILLITGAVLAYVGDLKSKIQTPLFKSVAKYKDSPNKDTEPRETAYKATWNAIMKDLKCCGVNNVTDWNSATAPGWSPSGVNKPEGCCAWVKGAEGATDISGDNTAILECRKAIVPVTELQASKYYFGGCFTKFESKVQKNKEVVIWVTVGAALVMVLTLLFALAMCMIV